MRWLVPSCAVVAILAGVPPAPAAVPKAPLVLPAGTRLSLAFETTVSSEHSHHGDAVVAKTTRNARGTGGEIAIPVGAELRGHVAIADPGGKIKGRARVSVVFDRVVLRGEELP